MTSAAPIDLRTTLAAVPVTLSVVTVTGPDAEAYLQGQLSQDVAALAEGATAPTLLLQPTGKLTAWLRVHRTGTTSFALIVDGPGGDDVLARLVRFKLRTDATFDLTERPALAVRGPGAADAVADHPDLLCVPVHWPGVEGVDLVPAAASERPTLDLPPAGLDSLDALRVEAGVPRMGAELSEATIPGEGGQWLIDASVSFTKGCYTGQELVARIDSRGGNVPRPVRGLRVSGDADPSVLVGAPVRSDGTDVGVITSAATSPVLGPIALAPLARSVEEGALVTVGTAGEREAVVVALPMR